jgi:hypothetical protein
VVVDVIRIRFSAGGLDDQPQQVVIQVAVLERRADRVAEYKG